MGLGFTGCATNLYRRCGVRGLSKMAKLTIAFTAIIAIVKSESIGKNTVFGPRTLRRTWGTRPVLDWIC